MNGPPLPVGVGTPAPDGSAHEPPSPRLHPVFDDWDLDVLPLSVELQDELVMRVFKELGLFRFLQLEPASMHGFIGDLRLGYSQFPEAKFHTYMRALSTTHMLYMCIRMLKNTLDMEEVCGLILAALCHDIGHNARNNPFHIRTKSAIAQKFHFQQVLEKMHHATGFTLVNTRSLLANLKKGQKERVLHIFRETIIHSGIAAHRDLKDKVQSFLRKTTAKHQNSAELFEHLSNHERTSLCCFLLHAADMWYVCPLIRNLHIHVYTHVHNTHLYLLAGIIRNRGRRRILGSISPWRRCTRRPTLSGLRACQ
jgi:hypothetical protein